jgi:hypothetical protein
MRATFAHPARPEGLHGLNSPIKIDGQRAPAMRAPAMGEHTAAYLGDGSGSAPQTRPSTTVGGGI